MLSISPQDPTGAAEGVSVVGAADGDDEGDEVGLIEGVLVGGKALEHTSHGGDEHSQGAGIEVPQFPGVDCKQ